MFIIPYELRNIKMNTTNTLSTQEQCAEVGTFHNGVFIAAGEPTEPIPRQCDNDSENDPVDEQTNFWHWYHHNENAAWRLCQEGECSDEDVHQELTFISDLVKLNMTWDEIRDAVIELWNYEAQMDDMCLEHQISQLSSFNL